jgi:hypothetical protein
MHAQTTRMSGSIRDQFLADHDRLESLFERLLATVESNDREDMARPWSEFESGLLGHMETEEAHMIPALQRVSPTNARIIVQDLAGVGKGFAGFAPRRRICAGNEAPCPVSLRNMRWPSACPYLGEPCPPRALLAPSPPFEATLRSSAPSPMRSRGLLPQAHVECVSSSRTRSRDSGWSSWKRRASFTSPHARQSHERRDGDRYRDPPGQ